MKKPMPFEFLLDHLPAAVIIKPAIGMFYIYWDKKIMLIFRKVCKNPQHNGIWISCRREDHISLKAEMPALTDFIFEGDEVYDTPWLLLAENHDNFEETAVHLCTMVSQRDPRIGKVTPKSAQMR